MRICFYNHPVAHFHCGAAIFAAGVPEWLSDYHIDKALGAKFTFR
jgi:hypothetical protein